MISEEFRVFNLFTIPLYSFCSGKEVFFGSSNLNQCIEIFLLDFLNSKVNFYVLPKPIYLVLSPEPLKVLVYN